MLTSDTNHPAQPQEMNPNLALDLQTVKKSFKEFTAVKAISLQVKRGEFCALLGPNGAGKTTLMEMVEGIQQPDSGTITINGKNWASHADDLHNILGISLQETHFFEKLNVKETLDLFGSFYNLPASRTNEILALVNLVEKQKTNVYNLSGGQRQRLSLGIALMNNPEIILLDEPTTGLDPGARREVWEILFKLKKEHKITLLLTTHYMEEADYLCDRIVIMDKGAVLADGTKDQLVARNNGAEIIEFIVDENKSNGKQPSMGGYSWSKEENTGKYKLLVQSIANELALFLESMKQQGIELASLECRKMTLEDVFIAMTGRRLSE